MKVRAIAFYLPQYHPIPENDEWWGKGFTEWANVTKAKPLFKGHQQPNLPTDLGFYDLRVPELREQQAAYAKYAGIEGFCYWHYWFGNGKKILDRPINEVITSGKPDFPFCLCWCNETWSGIWHGAPNKILIKQEYNGLDDYKAFFYNSLPAFKDSRYIKVNGKLLFLVYNPLGLPDAGEFANYFNQLAKKEGLNGFFLLALNNQFDYKKNGFDGCVDNLPGGYAGQAPKVNKFSAKAKRIIEIRKRLLLEYFRKGPRIYLYKDFIEREIEKKLLENEYPIMLTNWDNTPRSGNKGMVLAEFTPEALEKYLQSTISKVMHRDAEHRLLFVKAWNEWAEGNHLEPNQKYGTKYLEIFKQNICLNNIC